MCCRLTIDSQMICIWAMGLEHCCWSCSNQRSGIHWNHETDLFVVISSQDQVEPGYATTWIKWKYVGETVFQNLSLHLWSFPRE